MKRSPDEPEAVEVEGAVPERAFRRGRLGFVVGEVGQVAFVDLLGDGVFREEDDVLEEAGLRGGDVCEPPTHCGCCG